MIFGKSGINKNSILRLIYRSCREWYYWYSGKPRGLGYILMLHRVTEPNVSGLPQCEDLKVSVQHLERFIVEAKKKYDIIRIEDVAGRLNKKHKKKFLVFTFDDGYKDVLTEVLPLFQKNGIPFTVFLTASFAEQNAVLWWEKIETLLLANDSIILSNGNSYALKTKEDKIKTFDSISQIIKKLDRNNFSEELAHLFSAYNIDWKANNETTCLNWDDVMSLLSYPLFTLGSHTYNHFMLTNLKTAEDVKDEIMSAVALIKEKTGQYPKVFAYPHGGAGEREFRLICSLQNNISLSVLANGGPVTNHTNRLEQMPRINFDNSVNVKDLLHYRTVYMGI